LLSFLPRFRDPKAPPIKSVTANGQLWPDCDSRAELIRLHDVTGTVKVQAPY